MNKLLRFLTLGALALALVTACKEDFNPDREPSPAPAEGCMSVYFPTSNKAAYEFSPDSATVVTLDVARLDSAPAAEVALAVTVNTDGVFEVPATAVFAANQRVTTIQVLFPTAEVGKSYTLGVRVADEKHINQYLTLSHMLTTKVARITWTAINESIIMVNPFWGGDKHYIPKAEIVAGSGNIEYSIRLTNPFPSGGLTTGDEPDPVPDSYGIYSGVSSIFTGEVVREDAQIIIDVWKDTALMRTGFRGIGAQWYDVEMYFAPQGYGKAIRDESNNIVRVDFPANTLALIANSTGGGWMNGGTLSVFLSLDAYLSGSLEAVYKTDFSAIDSIQQVLADSISELEIGNWVLDKEKFALKKFSGVQALANKSVPATLGVYALLPGSESDTLSYKFALSTKTGVSSVKLVINSTTNGVDWVKTEVKSYSISSTTPLTDYIPLDAYAGQLVRVEFVVEQGDFALYNLAIAPSTDLKAIFK